MTAKPSVQTPHPFIPPHVSSPHSVRLHFPQHLPSSQSPSTWDERQASRDGHSANNLWCLSKEVGSILHTSGTFFLPLSHLWRCQKNILICNLWLEKWQTDRHMCTLHICFPALDPRSTVELRRERARERLLYNRWFSLRSRDETLCVTSALWSFLRLQSVQALLLGFDPMCWGQMSAEACIQVHTHFGSWWMASSVIFLWVIEQTEF